jgi:multidrug efflux system membrane fusion protein
MKRYLQQHYIAVLIVALIITLGFAIWWSTKPKAALDGGGRQGRASGPALVKVEPVQIRAMPIVLEAVGTIEAERSVEIRPEVTGVLRDVLFQEGQTVPAGQLLFRIDPATFEAGVEQAKANLARDKAQAEQAQAQANRLAPLAEKEYVTRQEYDQARATAAALTAAVAADQAQLNQAQIQLDRSRIRAPISGRTGNLTVKAGNLVSANPTQSLVTINQIKPVLVRFTIPQQSLPDVRQYNPAGNITVEIRRENKAEGLLGQGKLIFIDNNVNMQTGTVMLKARIPNNNESLWPGQFVTVRLLLTVEPKAVVVPEVAIQNGQQGTFVYVADDGKARMQPVTIARQVDNLVVIAKGVAGGEMVITDFPRNLVPGMPLKIQAGDQNETDQRTSIP